ncbi:hypothetical protein CHUAL_012208 [Chamberlinius hualienensis]
MSSELNLGLNLEWIYGFQSEICRNNVVNLSTVEIVYFVERVGVVFNYKTKQQRFYIGHNEDMSCLSVHPLKKFVATGQIGEWPYICVWETAEMNTVSVLKNQHNSGIAAIDFDHLGQKLASVGMEKNCSVVIWDWLSGQPLVKVQDQNSQIFFIRFSPSSTGRLITGGLDSFKFWSLSESNYLDSKIPLEWSMVSGTKSKTMLSAIYVTDDIIYTGSLSGNIYRWKSQCLDSVMENVHRGGVTVINRDEDGNYVSTGKDGHVQLWSPEMKPKSRIDLSNYSTIGKKIKIGVAELARFNIVIGTSDNKLYQLSTQPIQNIDCLLQGPTDVCEINALAIHPLKNLFVDGTKDGILRLWSAVDRKIISEHNLSVSINCCQFRPQGNQLAIGTNKDYIIIYRFPDLIEICCIRDVTDHVWVVKYSPDGVYLAVGKADGCSIYNVYQNYNKVNGISGCESPPVHLDWSVTGDHVQMVNCNGQRFVFRVHDGKLVEDKVIISSMLWSSWTCPSGTEIRGVWPKYMQQQINYVTSIDTNMDINAVVTGHHHGILQLHKFPKLTIGESEMIFSGHSSAITNVQFSHDKSRILTISDKAKTIFQWTVSGEPNKNTKNYQVEFLPCATKTIEIEDEFVLDDEIVKEIKLLSQCLQKKQMNFNDNCFEIGRDGHKKPPETGLQLQYIFGFRSFDCRNNLHFTSMGKVVYVVAAVGVVYCPSDRTQQFYFGHSDDILCCVINPSMDHVATGQIGAIVHVWNAKTMKTLSILEEPDYCLAILQLSFSKSGKRLLVRWLSEDGQQLSIWNWEIGQRLGTTEPIVDCLFAADWLGSSDSKFLTGGIGHLKFWTSVGNGFVFQNINFDDKTIKKTETILCATSTVENSNSIGCFIGSSTGNIYEFENGELVNVIKAHDGPVFCLTFTQQGILSGGRDGVVVLWDFQIKNRIRTFPVLKSYAFCKGSNRIYLNKDRPAIKSIDMSAPHGTIAVGTADGDILIMDKSGYYTIVNQIHASNRIYGLDSHPITNRFVTYGEDMTIRTWDIDCRQMISCKSLFRVGFCVCYSSDGNLIAAGHADGSVELMNAITLDTLEIIHHKTSPVVAIKFSSGLINAFLAVAHEDCFVDIFSSVCPWKLKATCDSKHQPITKLNFDTKENLLYIFTSIGRLVYEIPSGIEIFLPMTIEQPNYNSQLYTDHMLKYNWDISKNNQLVAIAKCDGELHLANFPIKMVNPATKRYIGNGQAISGLAWSYNDDFLITTNNTGAAIFIWSQRVSISERKLNYDSDESDVEYPEEGRQSFYVCHTDIISSLTINENINCLDIVASGQLSGQPIVHVWSAKTLSTIALLKVNNSTGIRCLSFSSCGQLLLGLTYDDVIVIWRWSQGILIIEVQNQKPIIDIKFRYNSDKSIVSVGKKHVKFWTIVGGKLIGQRGVFCNIFNDNEPIKTMLSLTFGKEDVTFTGAADGTIYEWKGHFLQRILQDAHSGPVLTMKMSTNDGLIVTGSKTESEEYLLKLWDCHMTRCKPFTIGHQMSIKSIDRSMGKIIIGNSDNCIYELDEKTGYTNKIIDSCSKLINNIINHPKQLMVISCDESRTVKFWDIKNNKMRSRLQLDHEIKCMDMDKDGEIMVLGSSKGHIFVVDVQTLVIISQKRDNESDIISIRVRLSNFFERHSCNALLTCFAMAPDRSLVAMTTSQGKVGFVSFPITHLQVFWHQSHSSLVKAISFTADKQYVITADDHSFKTWRLSY